MAIILGIETSCDDTSASICINGNIINNIITSQEIHKKYGGVVPELASRDHQKNILPTIQYSIKNAKITLKDINAIAYTNGPGLLGALLVGTSVAKAMAMALNIPVIPVHHIKSHVLSHFIEPPFPPFPFLCLTVSGGHTLLIKVSSHIQMSILGQTLDDAAGEAFDKAAKLMGLSYPGGAIIDQLAEKGNPKKFQFAESEVSDLNYSFSGIKTSILYFLKKETQKNKNFIENNLFDLAASIQYRIVNMLMKKLILAANMENINHIAISGGVSANSGLRNALIKQAKIKKWTTYTTAFEYCTDNAAMIAITGHFLYNQKKFGTLDESPKPRMSF